MKLLAADREISNLRRQVNKLTATIWVLGGLWFSSSLVLAIVIVWMH
jgi:preprotein translocase subunit SecG